ncbi:MAG: dockerin type I domain-containing protein, partial [Ignavibacteria bacterium]|nr:dockerin type I domain-containing protein [Ignavibacteria bacterium]
AYGDNMILQGTKYCIYSGEINGDGTIDAADLSFIDNDVANGTEGYISTDLNGDFFVDASDASIADNNASNSVFLLRP